MTAEMTTVDQCSANFTIDGQTGNQKVAAEATVTLQAEVTEATTYQWEVTSSPPDCDYQLTGETQVQATLSLPVSGAYVIQLTLSKGQCEARARRIVWAVTPHREYCLPATGEPLRFNGDEAWAGDLTQVIQDVDNNLPTLEQKGALDAADQPSETNPFITQSALPAGGTAGELTPEQKAALDAANEPSAENPVATIADILASPVRVVAAGLLDLKQTPPVSSPGGLRLTKNDRSRGLATLTFVGYNPDRHDAYVVTALPVNSLAGEACRQILAAEFVRFHAEGFDLRLVNLAYLPAGKPTLGLCMIEVSEILAES